jgi:hypothetical protein
MNTHLVSWDLYRDADLSVPISCGDRLDYVRIANNAEAKGSGPTLGSSAIRPSAAVQNHVISASTLLDVKRDLSRRNRRY